MQTPESRKAELALLAVTVLWGTSFTAVKSGLEDASALVFIALRFSIATALLGAAYRTRLERHEIGIRGGLYAGLCLAAGYVFQTAGLLLTTPARAAFLTATFIVLVPLLSACVYKNVPSVTEGLGVLISFLGISLFSTPEAAPGSILGLSSGDLLTLACAVAYAAHMLVVGHYATRSPHATLAFTQVAVVAAVALGTFWWAETPQLRWTGRLGVALFVTAILCTAIPFAVQNWAQRHTSATRAALIFSLEPVFASITSYLVTGESLPRQALAGGALILSGILTVELKPFQVFRSAPKP